MNYLTYPVFIERVTGVYNLEFVALSSYRAWKPKMIASVKVINCRDDRTIVVCLYEVVLDQCSHQQGKHSLI